ncbi:MAG: antibiotic biosynthesis monooxygenase [Halioglobus sp.]|nr:antibiotic biosynthesis monooxygenase [Halioglobus sp.]
MATLLCHIEINPGKEEEFEEVMKEMYRRTHAEEPNCVRYEYFRGARPSFYYCLLSFTDRLSFLQHQISDYHEGFDFASMIRSLEMEWVDPVTGASPLIPTESSGLPEGASESIKSAAEMYQVVVQSWWQQHRST